MHMSLSEWNSFCRRETCKMTSAATKKYQQRQRKPNMVEGKMTFFVQIREQNFNWHLKI